MTEEESRLSNEIKRRERFRNDIVFTSAEDFCLSVDKVWCSKRMNELTRNQAVSRLKYMASVMAIVDQYRTNMRDAPAVTSLRGQIARTYDLCNSEDVMALAAYFPYTWQHLFVMNMELILEGSFD